MTALAQDMSKLSEFKPLDRLDAADNVHFARELESILPDLVREGIAPTSVRAMFPVNTGFSPNIETITWRMLTITGAAKVLSDYADDIPLLNMFGEEKTTKVRTLWIAHVFSIPELQGAAEGSISLASEGPIAARDMILRLENTLAYEGSTKFDQVGLFSGTAITGIAQTNASAPWTPALAQGVIYGEMAALIGDIHEDSKTIHNATRIIVSPANFRVISTTQFSTASDVTILGYFRANHPGVDVVAVQEFSGGGAKGGIGGANDLVFAYNPNPAEIFLAIPMAIAQRPPTEQHLKVETIYWSRTGGFIIRQPMAMKFLVGT